MFRLRATVCCVVVQNCQSHPHTESGAGALGKSNIPCRRMSVAREVEYGKPGLKLRFGMQSVAGWAGVRFKLSEKERFFCASRPVRFQRCRNNSRLLLSSRSYFPLFRTAGGTVLFCVHVVERAERSAHKTKLKSRPLRPQRGIVKGQ